MIKKEIRKIIKEKRKLLSADEVNSKSLEIVKRFTESEYFFNSSVLMLYYPLFNEVNSSLLFEPLFNCNKTVLLPHTKNDNITPVRIFSDTTYRKGDYGIYEPDKLIPFPKNNIDTVIVPGVAFDRSGNRTGFGKGCYDRFLQNTNAVKIGFCYNFQIVEEIEAETFDIGMDVIFSESEMIICE